MFREACRHGAGRTVPREFAVKAEPRSEMTPEVFLIKSPATPVLGGAQPERLGQLLIELEQRLTERRKGMTLCS